MTIHNLILWAAAGVLLLGSQISQAAPVQVFSRAALGADDHVDWNALSPFFNVYNGPSTVPTQAGFNIDLHACCSFTEYRRVNEGTGWTGNFALGDHLVVFGGAGPSDLHGSLLGIDFLGPLVYGFGVQIQSEQPGPFTAHVGVIGDKGIVLGVFDVVGNSTADEDNSAAFLGVLDTTASISVIGFSVDGGRTRLAINTLDIVRTAPVVAALPEPGTLALLAVGLIGLGAVRRRERKRGAKRQYECCEARPLPGVIGCAASCATRSIGARSPRDLV
jgi:hypothetical protein